MKKLTVGEFFGEWLKCKVQLQPKSVNNASSLAVAMLHAMQLGETTLLSNAAFSAAIYVDPRYQALQNYSQKIIAQAHLTALWRRWQILQKSVYTTNAKCPNSFSESENGSTPASTYGVDTPAPVYGIYSCICLRGYGDPDVIIVAQRQASDCKPS